MAVTYNDNTVQFTAENDEITKGVKIQAAQLDHTAAATATLVDTAGHPLFTLHATAERLNDFVSFPNGIWANGVKVSALSGGTVRIFTK